MRDKRGTDRQNKTMDAWDKKTNGVQIANGRNKTRATKRAALRGIKAEKKTIVNKETSAVPVPGLLHLHTLAFGTAAF